LEIFWLKHAAFKIKTESGKIIYLDPFNVPKGEEKADIIISSHDHGDHFNEESINNVLKNSTLVLGPISISEVLDKYKGKGLELYEPFEVDDIQIEFIPAYNVKRKRESGEPFHPKERNWAGTILEIEGKKIYHAGDTERIPEMKELASRNIDVAMLPCGGMYTMDFEESTDVAVDIKAKIVIPMHNWDKKMQEYKNILTRKDSQIKVEILKNKSLKL